MVSFFDASRHYSKHGDLGSVEAMLQIWRNEAELDLDADMGISNLQGAMTDVLCQAVRHGHEAAVRMMLDAGVDPTLHQACDPGYSPLQVAAEYGQRDIARLLWNVVGPQGRFHHPSRRQPSDAMPSCLVVAAYNGHADLVADFLDLYDGWSTLEKHQALYRAAAVWHDDVVVLLLVKFHYQADIIQCALESALAISNRDYMDGIPVQRRDGVPLAEDGQIRLVRRLLDAGADPNRTCNDWRGLPIHESFRRLELLRLLLERGADPNAKDGYGQTVLHKVAANFNRNIVGGRNRASISKEDSLEVLQILFRHGASPEAPDNEGVTPLHLLAGTGTPDAFRLYLQHCANASSAMRLLNKFEESLLHYAAAAGNRDTVEYLLGQGLDADQANANKWTPLLCVLTPAKDYFKGQAAARIAVARLLLERGASAQVVTDEGWTPLHALATVRTVDATAEERIGVGAFAEELIERGTPVDAEATVLRYCSPIFTSFLYGTWGHRMAEVIPQLASRAEDRRLQAYDDYELTPLHWATRTGATDIFDVLMRHFASKEQTQPESDEGGVHR
ncbi:ankyrin repeat-containing domain protein [Neurospora tetraspora]|uniref:Ankyrin repeat-containing domain protein n=1 Tax=Neurospora tetraspora TaxID=94610 RepID=A0AAE0MPG0_9PEZI|nr:ankyrin repeat-containing domain protein [Neurospora tetraspora]